jgi:hypothetical protein
MDGSYMTDDRPLLCGMCHRRMCDIAIIRGDVHLLRAPRRVGIPQEKVPEGRVARGFGSVRGTRPRDPNVRIFEDDSDENRFRIVHHHKRGGRGPLDRTITAATLQKMYDAAVAARADEVVLR